MENDSVAIIISAEDGAEDETLTSFQEVVNWLSNQRKHFDWVKPAQHAAYQQLNETLKAIELAINRREWLLESVRIDTSQRINTAIRERRLVRPQSTFGVFVTRLRERDASAAAAAFAHWTRAPKIQDSEQYSVYHGVLESFAFEHGFGESKERAAMDMDSWRNNQEQWLRDVRKEIEGAAQALNSAESRFNDYMALKLPKDYWKRRARQQKRWAVGWSVCFLSAIAVSMWALSMYISEEMLAQDADQFRPWVAIRAIALATLAVWIIRFFAKNMYSAIHLATDAQERRTMISTYLALEKDGGLQGSDRHLILEPIFRPTADGLVKEDGGTHLLFDHQAFNKLRS